MTQLKSETSETTMWKRLILVSSIGIAGIVILYKIHQGNSIKDPKNPKPDESEPNIPTTNIMDLTSQEEQEGGSIQTPTSDDYNWGTSNSTAVNQGTVTSDFSVEAIGDWSDHPNLDINEVKVQNVTNKHRKAPEGHLFKGKVRCKYWPDCAFEKSVFQTDLPNYPENPAFCEFWHPDIRCENNNDCRYEKHCMFWHDKDFSAENRPYHLQNQKKFNANTPYYVNPTIHNDYKFKGQLK